MANPQAMNAYNYASNNPVTNKDPQGQLLPEIAAIALLGAIAAAHGMLVYGSVTHNTNFIQAGFALNDIGTIGGAGYVQTIDLTNPVTGVKNSNSINDLLIQNQLKNPDSGPYGILADPDTVAPGKDFTQSQKANILLLNMLRNGGSLRDNSTGAVLEYPEKSQKGIPTPANSAQVDHKDPKNPDDQAKSQGPNSYSNAQVLSAQNNRRKSNQ